MADAGDDRHPLIRWARRLAWTLLALVLAVHVYALALLAIPAPITLTMLQRASAGMPLQRVFTPLDDISPHLVRAVIAAEDTRFCQHDGLDMQAIEKALDEREQTGRVRGASTITQQTAKNVFLWTGGGWTRKAAEAWFAVLIDAVWGKRRVMAHYLSVAEWGDGVFGAEAAARVRFNKTAAELTAREAALLAAVLPSPNKWRLDPPGPYVRQRAATIEARMATVSRDGLAGCVLKERPSTAPS